MFRYWFVVSGAHCAETICTLILEELLRIDEMCVPLKFYSKGLE